MVRNYKKKTDRGSINEASIQSAIVAVRNGMKVMTAASQFSVNRTTLIYRLNRLKKAREDSGNDSSDSDSPCPRDVSARVSMYGSKYAARKVFTAEQEESLMRYLITCCQMHYGLTRQQTAILAFQYAEFVKSPNIPHQWVEKGQAGIDWVQGFSKRHKQLLSLGKPENTSVARATAFNKPGVAEFFSKFTNVMERFNFRPEQIFNLDETALSTVNQPVRVFAPKNSKQVGVAASAERGEQITLVGIICATGTFLPPVYVFPRVTQKYINKIMDSDDALPGSLGLGTKNGWMTSECFLQVLAHVKNHTRCSPDEKILLLLDNHSSHLHCESLEFCKENGIVMLTIPPHCSHKLQPLDISVYGPLKSRFKAAVHDRLVAKPGIPVKLRHIVSLSRHPIQNSFAPANIIKGFSATGIFPFNSNIFPDEDFMPCAVTDREEEPTQDDEVRVFLDFPESNPALSTQAAEQSPHQQGESNRTVAAQQTSPLDTQTPSTSRYFNIEATHFNMKVEESDIMEPSFVTTSSTKEDPEPLNHSELTISAPSYDEVIIKQEDDDDVNVDEEPIPLVSYSSEDIQDPLSGFPVEIKTEPTVSIDLGGGCSDLSKNMRTKTGKRSFACELCDYQSARAGNVRRHMRTHTGERPYTCKSCDFKFTTAGNLKTHQRIHSGEKPFACQLCDYKASDSGSLNRHMRTHTGENPFACELCDFKWADGRSLNRHMRTHIGEKHSVSKLRDLKCADGRRLTRHRTCTTVKRFECELCKIKCADASSLTKHVRTHTGEKPFACKLCAYKCADSGTLNRHKRTHVGENPFECELCDFKWADGRSLNRHMRTHTGEKPFACEICDSKVSRSDHLKSHMKRHGEKPFACELCDHRFTFCGDLKKH